MRRRTVQLALLAATGAALVLQVGPTASSAPEKQLKGASGQEAIASYGKLPLAFTANAGQTDSRVRYSAQGGGLSVFFTRKEAMLALQRPRKGVALALRFLGFYPLGFSRGRHRHRRQLVTDERRIGRVLLLASPAGAERAGIEPMARVLSRATSGVEPQRYGIGPVTAALTALERVDLKWDDIDSVELNEAFAAQSLACLRGWPDLDPAKVNPLGGAIAIGHPLGASGARILTTLVHHLAATGGRYGLASMCIGVGQGIAVVVENLRR